MRTTRNMGTLALLVMAGGLAVAAFGCVVDNGGPGPACYPDLYVNWQVTQVVGGVDTPITCDDAGATSVTGQVNGFTDQVPCPVGVSRGQALLFQLDTTGNYSAMVQLRDASGAPISQTAPGGTPAIYVDCSGNTQTPLINLSIN